MQKFLQTLFLIGTLATTVAFGQGEITISQLTGGVSGSPVSGGATNIAVFGISFEKADGATSEITQVIIQLSSGAAGKFTNPRLYRSNDTDFDGIGSEALVSTGTIGTTPDIFTFDGAPITNFAVSGTPQTTAQTRNFFVVVDVDPSADGTTPSIAPSISEVDITAATTVEANSFTGTTYSFTGIAPNITDVDPGSSTCVGESITIEGTGFSSPTVTINGVTASITSSSSTEILITAPGGAAIGTHPVRVENSNGSFDVSSNYTIKLIDPSIPVNPSKLSPTPNENFNIVVGTGTQTGVSYRVRRISPGFPGSFSASQNGNGGTLTFGPYSHNPPISTTYVYEVEASSSNCGDVTLTQTASVIVAALSADAGPDATICEGEGIVLGASPSVYGGSGFYYIEWTSNPPGFISNETNPALVPPLGTTTYTLSVTDSDGNTDSDEIAVTAQAKTDPADLTINFNPDLVSVENDAGPITLSFNSTDPGAGLFSGNAVNPATNKFFPTAAPLGENEITLNFTNANNCVTSVSRTINVYDPNAFLSVLEPFYCPVGIENLDIVVPSGYGYLDITLQGPLGIDIPSGTGWTKNNATREVQLQLSVLPKGKSQFTITYTYTYISSYIYNTYFDISCFCIVTDVTPVYSTINIPVRVPLTINNPPITEVKPDATTACRNDALIGVVGRPFGGIWLGPGISAVSDNGIPTFSANENGQATFDPALANIGFNNLRYVFEDNFGCRDTTYFQIRVFDIPSVDFSAGNGCVGIPLPFSPMVTTPPGTTIANYVWDYNDEFATDTVAMLTDPTNHTYTSSQTYNVKLHANTTDGCLVTRTRSVSVGDIPDIDLSWRGVCEDENTEFEITSNFIQSTINLVNEIEWEYGDGNSFIKNAPFVQGDKIATHSYANTGYYTARATITSNLGCTNFDTVSIFKVPTIGAIESTTYDEDFNGASFEGHGWKTGGTNSSWEWGLPGSEITTPDGGPAWVTNLSGIYNENEKSWVHSPCFDLNAIERPVISFDFRSLTREQLDGVVLQINASNNTNDDTQWKNVGEMGGGKNWFNKSGIFANPGNQTLLQSGWSGIDAGNWEEAIFALDSAIKSLNLNHVRFRFAFASLTNSTSNQFPEGFAFDNVKIAERDRIVLLESFTNSGGNNTGNEPNKLANQDINSNFLSISEAIKIEYHVGLGGPNADPLYLDNKKDANARAAYYGITATPFAFLDSRNGNLNTLFEEQKLASAKASIDTIITHASIGDSIRIIFTPKTTLTSPTVLRIVAVEKNIDLTTPNGETSFLYVMKQMLPDATGIQFEDPLIADQQYSVTVAWSPIAYNENELAIIAFLQNDSTKEVYQATILSTPNYIPPVNIITDIEPEFINQIRVFPNPANEELIVQLPATLPQSIPIKLYDAYGREVYTSSFGAGDRSKTITTQNLGAGVYILQLDSREGALLRKKVLVVH